MPKASELKRGSVVEINDQVYVVVNLECKSPSARGAATLYKVRFNNVQTKQKLDESFKGDDMLKPVDFVRRGVQFSYLDGDMFNFMDTEDYSQYTLSRDDLDDTARWLTEGLEGITAMLIDGQMVALDLPQSIEVAVIETAPGIKGASASARTKPATLANGIEIQVPEYLEQGEIVKVNTQTCKFMSRA